jgi:transketolase
MILEPPARGETFLPRYILRYAPRYRSYCILGDGECQEGQVWEAAMFAAKYKLDNLIAIVDYNKIQSLGAVSEVLELAPLADKLRAFRWAVREVDGHDHQAIRAALTTVPWEAGKPSCLIAHTIKGKGVDFMEDQLLWHYQSPDAEQVKAALRQLDCAP